MHGRLLTVLVLIAAFISFCVTSVKAQTFDPYIWQTNKSINVNTQVASPLIDDLRLHIGQVLANPPLAPIRLHYGDVEFEGYWLYVERGRIITTLAQAYPYLTSQQQAQVRTYVQTHLASGAEAPWNSRNKTAGEGTERHFHGFKITDGRFPKPFSYGNLNIPNLHVIYGLWLYGENTGDWATIQQYWPQIKTFYNTNKNFNILYGSMSGHIAMARLAHQFGDSAMQTTAVSDAQAQLSAGLNIATIESRQQASTYAHHYYHRQAGYAPGQPWMFLESPAEITRYLENNVKTSVDTRIDQFTAKYSKWWLVNQPLFSWWTGEEGMSTTSETIGIVHQFERWFNDTSPSQLAIYMRSMPKGIGDIYWLEALTSTIEAHGQTCWTDVRTDQQVTCEPIPDIPDNPTNATPTPTPAPTACQQADINQDGIVDLTDYSLLATNFLSTTPSNPRADINQDGIVDLTDYSLLAIRFLQICS